MQHTTPTISSTLKKAGAALTALLFVVAVVAIVSAPRSAFAVTAVEKQAEAEEALANLNAMQETLDRLSAEYGEALAAQEAAEASRDEAEKRINELNVQIADVQERLGERAREMYRSGGVSFLEILLGASSFEEFATTYDAVNIASADASFSLRRDLQLRVNPFHRRPPIHSEDSIFTSLSSSESILRACIRRRI